MVSASVVRKGVSIVANEPEYVFVRGQGWIPTFELTLRGVDRQGHKHLIIERTPKPGERFMRITTNGPWFKDGKLILEKVIHHLKGMLINDFYSWGSHDFTELRYTYLVVVPDRT